MGTNRQRGQKASQLLLLAAFVSGCCRRWPLSGSHADISAANSFRMTMMAGGGNDNDDPCVGVVMRSAYPEQATSLLHVHDLNPKP